MRVCAVNGTEECACCGERSPPPQAVSSPAPRLSGLRGFRRAARPAARHRRASSGTPGSRMNSVAWRLPSVMVPVLSSSSMYTSTPSTARPDIASTLCWTRRSMPGHTYGRGPAADTSWDEERTEQRNQHEQRFRRARIIRKRLQRHHEQCGKPNLDPQQDVQRNLIRPSSPLRALDERDDPNAGRSPRDWRCFAEWR